MNNFRRRLILDGAGCKPFIKVCGVGVCYRKTSKLWLIVAVAMKSVQQREDIMKKNIQKYNVIIFTAIVGAMLLTGCSLVSHYDSTSYKQLTDLKGEMKVFFEICQNDGASGDAVFYKLNNFKKKSAQAYEYEKGKKLNDDTVAQLKIIDETVSGAIRIYKSNVMDGAKCETRKDKGFIAETGCLKPVYCKAKWKVLSEKFDIAIATENLKIKDK
ncbi:MAG TPA: hypothetical protein ENI98_00930 [Gammaproteobacteria bacterium]|nr:hypothetical protein [Gammaproteobacteria bacterium]